MDASVALNMLRNFEVIYMIGCWPLLLFPSEGKIVEDRNIEDSSKIEF
jgi:hypothetical protein